MTATERPIDLTEAQQGVLNAQLIDPTAPTFTVGEAVHLDGAVDEDRLLAAIDRAVAEAAVTGLDLGLGSDPGGSAAFLRAGASPGAVVRDLSDHRDPDAAAEEWLAERMRTPFDLGAFPLHEQVVLRLGPERRIWLFRAHHVILDGYAITQVITRALALLGTGPADAHPSWVHPDEVVADQRRYLGSHAFDRDRRAWEEITRPVDGVEYAATGVLNGIGEATPAAVRCGAAAGPAPATVTAQADRFGATWADLALAATALHLARHADGDRVVVGVPLMNRLGSAAAQCPTMVTNVLPLVVDVDPAATVADLVEVVASGAARLRRHGRYRAERLQRDLGLLVSGRPLTRAEVNIKLFDRRVEVPGVEVRIRTLAEGPLDDLALSIERAADGSLSWSAAAPAGACADEVSGHLAGVLDAFAALVEADGATPVGRVGGSATAPRLVGPALSDWPDPAERFGSVVRSWPDRTALRDGTTEWTYAELDRVVARRAGQLRRAGVGHQDLVGIDLPRGAAYVVDLLALQRLGAVAVPLDAEWPQPRRTALLERIGARLVASAVAPDAPGEPVTTPVASAPGDLVHVIHTSGSTGFPKGVGVTRRGLGHFVAHHASQGLFADTDGDQLRVAQTLPLAFDGSWDTLQGLLLGHYVLLVDRDTARDPAALRALLHDELVDLIDTMPSLAAALLDEGLLADVHGPHHPSRISVGGEACSAPLWRRLRAYDDLRVLNLYGPTEFTVDALGSTGDDADDPVIGRPLTDTAVLVLDRHLRPVPVGTRGELHLAGVQEARGYLGQPGLTAERFVANPFGPPGGRMYRTGDVVSIGADGLVRYHGRVDDQAKIRGFRVEPAEVEAALVALDGVAAGTVVVVDQRLLAYAVPAAGAALDPTSLRSALTDRLPAHLVPSSVQVLAALPVTTTGKLDTAALPRPGVDLLAGAGRAPATEAEVALVTAVTQTLAVASDVPADADFFALGGDSITAIRVVAALRRAGWTSSVRAVFRLRTLEAIAADAAQGPVPAAAPAAPAAPASLVQLDEGQLGALGDLMARRTRRPRQPRQPRPRQQGAR